jgi:hypothetical protein
VRFYFRGKILKSRCECVGKLFAAKPTCARGFPDTGRVKDANYIADCVLQGICGHSFRAIGASKATQIRRDCAEAVRDE